MALAQLLGVVRKPTRSIARRELPRVGKVEELERRTMFRAEQCRPCKRMVPNGGEVGDGEN